MEVENRTFVFIILLLLLNGPICWFSIKWWVMFVFWAHVGFLQFAQRLTILPKLGAFMICFFDFRKQIFGRRINWSKFLSFKFILLLVIFQVFIKLILNLDLWWNTFWLNIPLRCETFGVYRARFVFLLRILGGTVWFWIVFWFQIHQNLTFSLTYNFLIKFRFIFDNSLALIIFCLFLINDVAIVVFH